MFFKKGSFLANTNYGFIWGMAGENLEYTDMDVVQLIDLR